MVSILQKRSWDQGLFSLSTLAFGLRASRAALVCLLEDTQTWSRGGDEEFNNPSPPLPVTASSEAGSDDAEISALNLSAEASPNALEIAKPGNRRKLLGNERRVGFDLPLEYSDNLENAYNGSDFEDNIQSKAQVQTAGGVRTRGDTSYAKRSAKKRQAARGDEGVGKARAGGMVVLRMNEANRAGYDLADKLMKRLSYDVWPLDLMILLGKKCCERPTISRRKPPLLLLRILDRTPTHQKTKPSSKAFITASRRPPTSPSPYSSRRDTAPSCLTSHSVGGSVGGVAPQT
ncbi:hypothetical protein MMC18_006354 [Xylographa bjoerkii]|nr:hypothetical protein [Xylographa bjoerkii]